ncbi:hypothetical protein [uncultured Mitsuokella sp.]|uniref:hypothetical protein n=1 Tax=uncultured Mitsuokella sp. TaxID=453120 RepID=UPI00338F3C09
MEFGVDCLITHDHRASRHRIETGEILGQLQGKGGIAVIILAGNDTDVIVLRGIRGVVHQFILGNATLDSHLLIQGGIGCFTIITGELQAIIQCSYRMRMAIAAIIGNTGHRRLCSDH